MGTALSVEGKLLLTIEREWRLTVTDTYSTNGSMPLQSQQPSFLCPFQEGFLCILSREYSKTDIHPTSYPTFLNHDLVNPLPPL
jgi:hypothetical protein